MLDFQAARWLMKGEVAEQAGNNHPTSIPTGVFKTLDGHINIAATGDAIWVRLCEVLGMELRDPLARHGAAWHGSSTWARPCPCLFAGSRRFVPMFFRSPDIPVMPSVRRHAQ